MHERVLCPRSSTPVAGRRTFNKGGQSVSFVLLAFILYKEDKTFKVSRQLYHFHFLHHGLSTFEFDSDFEIGKVAIDVKRDGLVLLGLIVELQADIGA